MQFEGPSPMYAASMTLWWFDTSMVHEAIARKVDTQQGLPFCGKLSRSQEILRMYASNPL